MALLNYVELVTVIMAVMALALAVIGWSQSRRAALELSAPASKGFYVIAVIILVAAIGTFACGMAWNSLFANGI